MSSKSRAPAHQNSFAYKHNKNSRKTAKILSMPNVGLCKRCHDIIEWRKKYRKYRPLTKPHKCNVCNLPEVKAAYHHVCTECANEKNICPKCMESKEIYGKEEEELEELRGEIEYLENTKGQIPGMTERERRTLLRELYKQAEEAGIVKRPRVRRAAGEKGEAGGEDGDYDEAEGAMPPEGALDTDEEGDEDHDDDEDYDEYDAEAGDDNKIRGSTAATAAVRAAAGREVRTFDDAMAHADEVGDILTRALASAKLKAAAMEGRGASAPSSAKPVLKAADGPEEQVADPWETQQRLSKLVVVPKSLGKKTEA